MAKSFTSCIKEAGDLLSAKDRAAATQAYTQNLAAKMPAEEAARAAIQPLLDQAQAEVNELAGETAPVRAPQAQPASPSMQIAAQVRQIIETRALEWRELFEIADRAYGGTQADGAYTPKDAYDALEAGVNQYIMARPSVFSPAVEADQALLAVKALQNLVSRLPTQSKRTSEQDEFQQYSTIPPFAYVAAWVSGVKVGDLTLEPSAGIGGLSAFARVAGSNLVLNELSSRRAAVLREVFPDVRVFQENAEQIDNILPDNIRPTVVIMNPPFSASAGRGVKSTALGARHVEQAFDRLEDGGRLVAIVGEGMAMDKPAFREWWAKMKTKADIRAVVPMDGSGYAKYGTTFDNVLIVMDKVKPSGRPVVTTPAKDYTELIGLLAAIRNERPNTSASLVDPGAATQPDADRGTGGASVEGRGGNRLPGDAPAGAGGAAGVGTGEQPGGPAVAPGGGKRGGSGRGAGSGRDGAEPGNGAGAGTGTDAAGGRDGGSAAGTGSAESGLTVESQQVVAGELTDSVYEVYTPQKLKVPGAQAHPGALVQSSAMSSVEPPDATYTPNLPADTVNKGLLSIAQIESVVYAGQAHQQMLETVVSDTDARDFGLKQGSQYRRGFFIGDGTGPQPMSAKILTPSGWTTMGSIAAGDEVIAVDGTAAKVVGVFDKGMLPTYRITFSDGSSTEASGNHLWATQNRSQRSYEKHGYGVKYGPPTIRTTDEIARNLKHAISIPLVKSIQFPARSVGINPWLLGCLLGDGCLRNSSIQVVLSEPEMVEAAGASLPDALTLRKVESRDYHYNIVKHSREWAGLERQSNPLLVELRRYGLAGLGAAEKFIPDEYKLNAESVRLGVLRGLMDTDGYCGPKGAAVYYTISDRLADDVVFIVRSLGGIATRGLKKTTHRDCHVVYVKLPEGMNPFALGRKAGRVRASWVKYPPRRIVRSVELVGEKQCRCIAIDHPDHLYLTDDLIVTHNTGKGREIGGIILDNLRQGRKKHVWISEKQGLMNDAKRDFDGVGGDPALIFNQNKAKVSDPIKMADGVVFTTYSTLRGEEKADATNKDKKAKTRLDQLVDWLGKDFDGVIAADEAHNAGNGVPMKGERGWSNPSAQALALINLQKRLPNARVVYVSATGATEVSNLSFATRLGLWGTGTPFESVGKFIDQMTAGGLATMELVARDMKQMGAYIARSLSFDGVTYSRAEHELSSLQRDQYDKMAEAWQVVLRNMMTALQLTGAISDTGKTKNGKALANAKSAFWGAHQRFFNQIITSMQMPTVLDAVDRDLEAGRAVLLQLVNTNEAQQERALAKKRADDEEDLEDLDLTPREQLLQMVQKAFPVQQMEDFIDDNGKKQTRPVMDSEGKPVENKAAVRLRDKLLQDLQDIRVPDGPLEILLNHFGPEIVAEVTGRKQRVVRKPDDKGVVKAQIEKRGAASARADADAFMADKKKILIFSDAGGTGFSFHADKTKKNQRKRSHYLIQPGWRANKAVQGFGRSHRTNQASAPHYVLASTDIPAHKRFLSSIARRLDQLGALTKGERKTGGGMFSEKDNLESKYAGQAVRQLFEDAQKGGVKGLDFQDFLKQLGLEEIVNPDTNRIAENNMPDVRKFLNRMLSLKLDMQNVVFDAFIERMEEKIETAAQRGELDSGMQTIRAMETQVVTEETVYTDERTGAKTSYVQLDLIQPTTIYPFPDDKGSKTEPVKWLVNNRSGRVWAQVRTGTTTTKQGAIVDRYRMYGTGGIVTRTAEEFQVKGVYSEIGEGQAREMWAKENAAKPQTYTEQAHMIVGALLPIWDRLDTGKPMQVARTQTADNRRILGRLIAAADVAEIRKRLNVAAPESKLPPEQVIARVLKGETGELANGWKLVRSRVSDDLRVELKLDRPGSRALELEFKQAGIITERIGWVDRYFIPLANPQSLAAVLKNRPLVSLAKPAAEDGKFSRGVADGAGVAMADAKAVADAIRAANPGAPPIYVHEGLRNAPESVRDFIRKAGAELDVEAVYEAGEIHVFPQNIASVERMAFVVGRHELRHHGLRGMLGSRMNPLLLSLWGKNTTLRERAQAKIDAGLAGSRVEAVEEALADMPADEIEALTGIDRLVAAVRQWLRDLAAKLRASGFQTLAGAIEPQTWTDADVAALVQRAEAVSKRPGGVMAGTGAGPAFQRAFHGTPYRGIERFSTDKMSTGEGNQAFGWGLYFTNNKEIADYYRANLGFRAFDVGVEAKKRGLDLNTAGRAEVVRQSRAGDENGSTDEQVARRVQYANAAARDIPLADLAKFVGEYRTASKGQLYEVEIPEDGEMLLWDKPIGQQPEQVKQALKDSGLTKELKENLSDFASPMNTRGKLNGENIYAFLQWKLGSDKAASEKLLALGIRGINYPAGTIAGNTSTRARNYVVFSAEDAAIQSAMFSRASGLRDRLRNAGGGPKIVGDTRRYTDKQRAAMRNIGAEVVAPTLEERARELWKDAGKKLAQGIADQFAPVKDISMEAYGLLRLAKGASGAFETMLNGGRLKLTDNVYDFDETARGGVIERLLVPLAGEHHDFFRWIAAKRAEQLKSQGRERLFTDADIDALKTLADGTTEFDYTIQHGAKAGTVTRDRTLIYADSLITFNEFNKNVMDMAEQSGLIDGESRSLWESEFYVPFYRVNDDENGGVQGMNIKSGVVRQQAFKKLKGGEQKLNADLLDNTLMNWAHLLDAAAKNRAARATLEAAENMGSAISAPERTAREMASAMGKKSNVVWYMDRGAQRYYVVEEPMLLSAITSLQFAGMQGWAMKALGSFKHALTVGVTVSPFFKIRNLIRDSVQAIASAPLGANPIANVAEGWKASSPKSDQYFRMMAGGGSIHFGSMMEGSEAKRVQKLVEIGVDKANILDSDAKMKAFWKNIASRGWNAYNELGNRGEDVNRAALYKQLRSQGVSHAEASLMARDLMDFSMQGTWTSVRFLAQTVPFFNARIQGLYKLGRAAKEDPARFSAVIGAAALMSIGLVLMFGDDPDWQKREEWDRNNYWWFKFGGMAFRIPKPFEIGAIATLAERSWELAFDKQMTGERFRKQVLTLLADNLSMNPVPQLVKPMLDVYANKDFMGRPIERQGMENLAPELRYTSETSMAARALSGGLNAVTGVVGAKTLSPVQVDHLVRGYFGWLGSFVVQAGDVLARPATGQVARPESDMFRAISGGMVADLRDAPSRYVSAMYEQAKAIEMAYGTWKELVRQGRQEEAAEYREDNMGLLSKYKAVERVKRASADVNKQIKTVEQSQELSPGEKRARLRELFARREALAKPLVMEP